MTIISKNSGLFNKNFNYEEDDYDRLKNINSSTNKNKCFTNKATMKTLEFDYEEDPYEPEKNR